MIFVLDRNSINKKLKKLGVKITAVGLGITLAVSGTIGYHLWKGHQDSDADTTLPPGIEDNLPDESPSDDYVIEVTPETGKDQEQEDDLFPGSSEQTSDDKENTTNTQQGDTTKPEDTKNPGLNDSTSSSVETKHKHQYTYISIDDTLHEKKCEGCGETEKIEHFFCVLSSNYIYNYNFYTQETIYECKDCHHRVVKSTKLEDIQFGDWVYNEKTKQDERKALNYDIYEARTHQHDDFLTFSSYDEENEYYTCICGYQKAVKHRLDAGKKLEDGSTFFDCLNEECGYTKTLKPAPQPTPGGGETKPQHTHAYNTLLSYDANGETWECSCGKTTTKSHSLTTVQNADYSQDVSCENPGCSYSYHIDHSHAFDSLTRIDEDGETWECECGETTSKQHQLKTTVNPDGSQDTTCENEGCTYTKHVDAPKHEHNQDGTREELIEGSDEDCYKIVTYCTTCNEVMGTQIVKHTTESKIEFTYDVDSECYNTVVTCTHCGKELSRTPTEHNFEFNGKQDEEYEYLECACGMEKTRNHTMDYENGTYDGTKTHITYKCTTDGCGHTETKEHHHDYQVDHYDDDQEYLTCPCGEEYTRPHSYEHGDWGQCQTCGSSKEQPHQHVEYLAETDKPASPVPDYCYIEIYKCSDCQEEIRRVSVPHDLDYDHPVTSIWGTEYHCKNMDCDYFIEIENDFSSPLDPPGIEEVAAPVSTPTVTLEETLPPVDVSETVPEAPLPPAEVPETVPEEILPPIEVSGVVPEETLPPVEELGNTETEETETSQYTEEEYVQEEITIEGKQLVYTIRKDYYGC